ncbi:MAG TPA: CcmD family protein [Coriobacteriia bacterium]
MDNTVLGAASEVSKVAVYVIAAYVLIWVTLAAYIGLVMRRLGRLEREVAALDEAVQRRGAGA